MITLAVGIPLMIFGILYNSIVAIILGSGAFASGLVTLLVWDRRMDKLPPKGPPMSDRSDSLPS